MKERIWLVAEYEIEYKRISARDDAIEAALEGGIDVSGFGPSGAYRAKRLSLKVNGEADAVPQQESLL